MSEFFCDIEKQAAGAVMTLSGQITYEEMRDFQTGADRLVGLHPSLAVLDLKEVPFISSAGLSAMLQLHRRLREEKCEMRLAATQPTVTRVLELARLDQVFPMFPTVDQALSTAPVN